MDDAEEIRKKLRDAFFVAFDRWGAQNFDKLVDPEVRRNNPETFRGMHLEDLFMSKRVFITGFYRHVTRSVMANADIQRQLRTITKAALISVLKTEGVSVRELEGKTTTDESYTRRNVQNILRQRYTNTFFETQPESNDDGNVKPYSSIFAPDLDLPLTNPIQVRTIQLRDKMAVQSNAWTTEWMKLNAMIEVVFPERIKFLIGFKKLCGDLLLAIGDHSSTGKVLATELSSPTEIFQLFANHMLSIVSVAWFNGRQEQTKRKLIHDGFPFEFTEEDATLACSLLSEFLGSEEIAAENILLAADALVKYGSPESALMLYQRCVELPNIGPWYRGTLHENAAVIHRNGSKPKLMVIEMKRAIESYRLLPDKYRLAVALKNLGEAEWNLGYERAGMDYFRESESIGETLTQKDYAAVLWNLFFSARRLGQPKMEKEYLLKCLKACPEDMTEQILATDRRLGELS